MNIWNLLFTHRCIGCGDLMDTFDQHVFCAACAQTVRPADKTEYALENIEQVVHVYNYEGSVRTALIQLKHEKNKPIRDAMATAMEKRLTGLVNLCEYQLVTCIPRYKEKKKVPYCQAEFLAQHIAKQIKLPLYAHLLYKKHKNRSQTTCRSYTERARNVRNIFGVDPQIDITGKKILLVDDILTTGATLQAAAEVLKKAGASEICAITAAYTPQHRKVLQGLQRNEDRTIEWEGENIQIDAEALQKAAMKHKNKQEQNEK